MPPRTATIIAIVRAASSVGGPGRPLRCLGAALAVFGAQACTIDTYLGSDEPARRQVADVPPTFRHDLDLLFVVEDSAEMTAVQQQLGAVWERVRDHLAYAEGGFPSVRIGVVSTDLGVGLDGVVTGCTATGSGGVLRRGTDGTAWIDVDPTDPAGFDAAVSERLQLGTGACPFEQPLAAMRRALDSTTSGNAGFVRDGAALGVVFVAGADDCSIANGGFFDDGAPTDDTFRCFLDGVHCVGDDVGDLTAGVQQGCVARDSNEHLLMLDDPTQFLAHVQAEPEAVAVGALIGNPTQVTIEDRDGALALSPACADAARTMYPGVRLGAFAGAAGGAVADLCSMSVADAGSTAALDLRRALGHRCIEESIDDIEPGEPGLQFDCKVSAVSPDGTRELASCPSPDHIWDGPVECWAIVPSPSTCGDFTTQLAVQVNWGGDTPTEAPPDTHTVVECVVVDAPPPILAVP